MTWFFDKPEKRGAATLFFVLFVVMASLSSVAKWLNVIFCEGWAAQTLWDKIVLICGVGMLLSLVVEIILFILWNHKMTK